MEGALVCQGRGVETRGTRVTRFGMQRQRKIITQVARSEGSQKRIGALARDQLERESGQGMFHTCLRGVMNLRLLCVVTDQSSSLLSKTEIVKKVYIIAFF